MNQKLEALLRLSLQTPEEVRIQTEDLNVGFDSGTRDWELIVKYHGSLDVLEGLGIGVEYLIAGYAILTVPEPLVENMVELEQIEYVEQPKRYFYERQMPVEGSCITQVTRREPNLTGRGVIVAVLDSGERVRIVQIIVHRTTEAAHKVIKKNNGAGPGRAEPEEKQVKNLKRQEVCGEREEEGSDAMRADRDGLVDIRDIRIDRSKSVKERLMEYREQVSDPFLVRYGDYVIKFGYADTDKSMEDRMTEYAAKIAETGYRGDL